MGFFASEVVYLISLDCESTGRILFTLGQFFCLPNFSISAVFSRTEKEKMSLYNAGVEYDNLPSRSILYITPDNDYDWL